MIIDIVFLLVMLLAVFKGFSKGFIVGFFSLITVVIGIAAAIKLSALLASYLKEKGNTGQWIPVVSFLIVFIIVVLLVRLGARLIEKTIQLAMLGWLNRLGGIILYVLLYSILFSVFLFYVDKMHMFSPETLSRSVVYPYIAPWGETVLNNLGRLLPIFKNMFQQLEDFFGLVTQT